MELQIDKEKGEIRIEVSKERFRLKVGEFSPWTRVTFKPGLGMKVKAIAKFLVSSIEPHFEMYLTPLNIDPRNRPCRSLTPLSIPYT
jgi:hypothetical protein